MALSARQLTKLIEEVNKARENLDKVLDFADLMRNNLENLPSGVDDEQKGIREHSSEIGKHIKVIKEHIQSKLDEHPVNEDDVKDAANKLLLYHGDVSEVKLWSETQKSNHPEGSYWWRYWQGVYDAIQEQEGG